MEVASFFCFSSLFPSGSMAFQSYNHLISLRVLVNDHVFFEDPRTILVKGGRWPDRMSSRVVTCHLSVKIARLIYTVAL